MPVLHIRGRRKIVSRVNQDENAAGGVMWGIAHSRTRSGDDWPVYSEGRCVAAGRASIGPR